METEKPIDADGGGQPKPAEASSGVDATEAVGVDESVGLHVVAIGASAGGLEVIRTLLGGFGNDLDAAVIVAMHLSPTHQSQMQQILEKSCLLKVRTAESGQILRAGEIYVTPPNVNILVEGSAIRLEPADVGHVPKPSCDKLFSSLAAAFGEQAIAVVLSGTGSDGAIGIRSIKQEGGVVIVQSPEDAKYPGMPSAAIETGCTDLVTEADHLSDSVRAVLSWPSKSGADKADGQTENDEIKDLLRALKRSVGIDFSYVKSGTLNRRISRRCALHGNDNLKEYIARLKADSDEAAQLAQSILISVTSFFRDPECWDEVRELLKELITSKGSHDHVRIWVAACATGEEAYTIAMLCLDAIDTMRTPPNLTIFASDLDERAIDKARLGQYPADISNLLPDGFEDKFFNRNGDLLQLRARVRRTVVFSVQNLLADPPFSRIDFVTCRNFLIYLVPEAQRRIFEMLHYSLVENGVLMLGASETPMQSTDLFREFGDSGSLYSRGAVALEYRERFASRLDAPFRSYANRDAANAKSKKRSLADAASHAISSRSCSRWVVVDDRDIVKYISNDFRPFLVAPKGPAIFRIFDVLSPELNIDLRGLMYRARKARKAVTGPRFLANIDGSKQSVTPNILPLGSEYQGYWIVVLDISDDAVDGDTEVNDMASGKALQRYAKDLESQIEILRQDMSSMGEELETSNEELQSQSEELQSANEELQSINEQLLTSNEELQSSNEELQTVNAELRSRSSTAETETALLQFIGSLFKEGAFLLFDHRMCLRASSGGPGDLLDAFMTRVPKSGESFWDIAWRKNDGDIPANVMAVRSSGEEISYSTGFGKDRGFKIRIASMDTDHAASLPQKPAIIIMISKE